MDSFTVEDLIATVRHNTTVPGLVALYSALTGEATSHSDLSASREFFADRYAMVVGALTEAVRLAQVNGLVELDRDPAAIARLLYAVTLTLAAAAGLSLVAVLAGLSPAPPGPPGLGIDPMTLLWRAVACFAGGCGYGILFNNPLRSVLAVALLTMVGNEVRLGLHDLGLALPSATFFGALVVGLGASLMRDALRVTRIALTVPSIIMMVPGLYAFQTIVFLNQGRALEAIGAATVCCFAIGAMAMGLIVARFLTERQWRFER